MLAAKGGEILGEILDVSLLYIIREFFFKLFDISPVGNDKHRAIAEERIVIECPATMR